ncbi:MAG: cell division protein FtsL [Sporolactobacillus sp.]|jgi:cell division protein FtsL|nr:cell division protein FtsL [Sporolactobacillus sp.]
MTQSQHAWNQQRSGAAETKRQPVRKTVVISRPVTRGEKILWAVAFIVVFLIALCMVANQTRLYQASQDIQKLQGKLDEQSSVYQQLKAEADHLDSPERIVRFAEKELGLKLDIKNIKVLP